MARFLKIGALAAVVLLGMLLGVSGTEEGSFTVSLPHGGGSLTAYRVGETGEGGSYILAEAFAQSGAELNDTNSRETATLLAAHVEAEGLTGISAAVNGEGEVLFTDLQPGIYLVIQRQTPPGYQPVHPFLVRVPGTVPS